MSRQAAVIVEESSQESILDMVVTQEERDSKYTQQSLAAALLQAINTSDQSLFDSCFEVQEEQLIDGTVKAMIGNNAKIQSLSQQIQKRIHQTGRSVQIWLSALLKYHSSGLVTSQLECFNEIKGQLQGQWNIGRLTRLRGKIDMVLAARRALEQKDEGMQWDDSSSSNVDKNGDEKEEINEESSVSDSELQEEGQEFEEEEEEEESSFNEDDEEEEEEDDQEEIVEVVKKSSKQAKQSKNSKQQANKTKNSQTNKKAAVKSSEEDIDEEDSDYLQI